MKEETRVKREKMKEKILDLEKEVKKSSNGKKLSTAEKNKAMLDLMTKKEEEPEKVVEEGIEESEKEKKPKSMKHKSFKCSCGMKVELYGGAEIGEGKCSKCLDKDTIIYTE